jgi:hypothetical protein
MVVTRTRGGGSAKNKQGFFRIGKEMLDGRDFSQNQLLYLAGGAVAGG